jgi:uncharacterized protein (TIGR02246 family)
MDPLATERQDFISYPTNRVTGTVADAKTARATIDALLQAGFRRGDIEVLHGEDDLSRLDPTGADHGFLEQFQRTLFRTAARNEEYKHLTRHVEDLRAGRYVIMVLARQRDERITAADILSDHGAEFIGFYGRWAWTGLPADAAAATEGSATGQDRSAAAAQPEHIARLFVEAWNARDANAIAELFDEDADFVNVAGLWWHDRDAIRQAHAYGLERIFKHSTLTIVEIRVKPLGDDVAVVHARMSLAGQTPIGNVTHPGPRANVFSFVAHRVGTGWRCAAAHNTDVVPHMETNIADESGTLTSANYRTGTVSDPTPRPSK